jgi:hypothetical protein
MKSSKATFSLILILLFLVIAIVKRWQEPVKGELFDRTPEQLHFTKHSLCRMDCRQISKEDIEEVMEKGVINLNKSDKNDRPCPVFALQGRTSDKQYIRVIFAQCRDETKVVTCYDLEKDFTCHCPGVEKREKQ